MYIPLTGWHCKLRPNTKGELWSTGLAITKDGGESWQLAAPPPRHLVAALPTKFTKDETWHGYGAISSMLQGDDGKCQHA
jgi:hypothetical protein